MFGLLGLNWFNQNNSAGRDLWALTLAEGGGHPEMKHNPIYVKEKDESATEIIEEITEADSFDE